MFATSFFSIEFPHEALCYVPNALDMDKIIVVPTITFSIICTFD